MGLRQKVLSRNEIRITFDYYRNKMPELEKTCKGSADAKKRERYESNVAKQLETNTKYD